LNLGFLQIDGIWSTVGSTNLDLDYRSFALNDELNVCCTTPPSSGGSKRSSIMTSPTPDR